MNKIPTLSNRETTKWLDILGKDMMMVLYTYRKINLTSEQLSMVIDNDKTSKEIKEELDIWGHKIQKVIKGRIKNE